MRRGEVAEPISIDERVEAAEVDVTTDTRAFGILVRNEVFAVVRALGRRWYGDAADMVLAPEGEPTWSAPRLEEAMAGYFTEHGRIKVDGDARAPASTKMARAGET